MDMAVSEEPRMRLAERVQVAKFDHDCEDGHSPGCRPFETVGAWFVEGQPVTDPEVVASLEAQLQRHIEEGR